MQLPAADIGLCMSTLSWAWRVHSRVLGVCVSVYVMCVLFSLQTLD